MIQDVQITSPSTPAAASCACCGPNDSAPVETAASTPESSSSEHRATYAVAGMTCGHCVSAVRAELSDLEGVTAVDVDLVAGGTSTVTVTSTSSLDAAAAAAAIEEAGYRLDTPTRRP